MPRVTKEKKEELTVRINAAKEKLPPSGVTTMYAQKYPQHCDANHIKTVSNVLSLRSFDEAITARLEELAKGYAAMIA